jgi:hypothetical protein
MTQTCSRAVHPGCRHTGKRPPWVVSTPRRRDCNMGNAPHSPSSGATPSGADANVARSRHASMKTRWYRAFAVTLAFALLSAVASITVVLYISDTLRTTVGKVDRQSALSIDLRRTLASQVATVHQLMDLGSPAAASFLVQDARGKELLARADATFTTDREPIRSWPRHTSNDILRSSARNSRRPITSTASLASHGRRSNASCHRPERSIGSSSGCSSRSSRGR